MPRLADARESRLISRSNDRAPRAPNHPRSWEVVAAPSVGLKRRLISPPKPRATNPAETLARSRTMARHLGRLPDETAREQHPSPSTAATRASSCGMCSSTRRDRFAAVVWTRRTACDASPRVPHRHRRPYHRARLRCEPSAPLQPAARSSPGRPDRVTEPLAIPSRRAGGSPTSPATECSRPASRFGRRLAPYPGGQGRPVRRAGVGKTVIIQSGSTTWRRSQRLSAFWRVGERSQGNEPLLE